LLKKALSASKRKFLGKKADFLRSNALLKVKNVAGVTFRGAFDRMERQSNRGGVAKWLGIGLQNRVHQFNSGRHLQISAWKFGNQKAILKNKNNLKP
jgi:hypothetical protein